jgi:hypothetical protein
MQRNALCNPLIPPDEKHKIGVTFLGALFLESIPVPPKHEKWCASISRPGQNAMNYVTRISNQMQKHKFVLMGPITLFVESELIPPELEQ